MKKGLLLIMALVLALSLLSGCNLIGYDAELDGAQVVANVNGRDITKAAWTNYRDYIVAYEQQYMQQYYGFSMPVDEETLVTYGETALEQMIQSFVVEDKIKPTRETVRVDEKGQYATYTDERVLVTEGKTGRISEAYRVSYDWDSGEEVSREKLSTDVYDAGVNIYYVGVQDRLAIPGDLLARPTLGPAATGRAPASAGNGF